MGHRPVAPAKISYENTWLYLTLCPFTGVGFAAFLPKLNSVFFGWFVSKVRECLDKNALFIADGSTAHKVDLFDNEQLVLVCLPAASPELNPVERFFKEIRRHLKFRVLATLEEAKSCIRTIVERLFEDVSSVVSLTCLGAFQIVAGW